MDTSIRGLLTTKKRWSGKLFSFKRRTTKLLIVFLSSLLSLLFLLSFQGVSIPYLVVSGDSQQNPAFPKPGSTYIPGANTDLVQYVYFETEDAKANLEFFLRHALHSKADFLFIVNGNSSVNFPTASNLLVIYRNNSCFDLGTHGLALNVTRNSSKKTYKRTIIMNSSIRGPFFPLWTTKKCWSDKLFERLNEKTKIVGLTANCAIQRHIQSMLIAIDPVSIELMLPFMKCFNGIGDAIYNGEIQLTKAVLDAGYKADVLMHMPFDWNSTDCPTGDIQLEGHYAGSNLHPFETLFVKTKRFPNYTAIPILTKWLADRNFTSYDYCI